MKFRKSFSGLAGVCAMFALMLACAVVAGLFPATLHAASTGHRALLGIGAGHLLITGMIINPENISGLTAGFSTIFGDAFAAAQSKWEKIAMKVPSSTRTMTYAWLGMSTRFKEWLGDRVVQNLKEHGFTITNKRFENTVGVPRDDITDDQYGVYKPLFQQLGYDAKTHPDELTFALLLRGFVEKCFDGQPFFDADHPVADAAGVIQSVSNFGGGAGTPWFLIDATKPIKPVILQMREEYNFTALDKDTDENVFKRNEFLYGATGRLNVGLGLWQLAYGSKDTLDKAHYGAARAAMQNFTADGGKKLNITPSILLVPPTLEGAANALIKAQKDAAGADNIWFGTAEVVVAPWLE
jgi:phage major head subunit gpT-like protein